MRNPDGVFSGTDELPSHTSHTDAMGVRLQIK